MPFPFANHKRDADAGTPVLPTTGGTAAGSVGAAVPLPWVALAFFGFALSGCTGDARQSACFPESMTAGVTEEVDVHGRATVTGISTSFKWRLKPAPVVAVSLTNPDLNPSSNFGNLP